MSLSEVIFVLLWHSRDEGNGKLLLTSVEYGLDIDLIKNIICQPCWLQDLD